jgi:membrane protease YdiL (CAAX protease family)
MTEFSEKHSFAFSLLLMVMAAISVPVTLIGCRSIWATFLTYHVVICLVVPLVESRLVRHATLRDHARYVGITGGDMRAGVMTGLTCALAMGGGIAVSFALFGSRFLHHNRAAIVLERWGLDPGSIWLMLVFMVLFNGIAEELFWRGYMHRRLDRLQPRWSAIALIAAFYASYHAVTIGALFHDTIVTVCFLLAVLTAGCLWGWLRDRHGNSWPALLGHMGATAGYMIVYWTRIVRGGA